MSLDFTAYTAALSVAALVSGVVVVHALRQGAMQGGGAFALTMTAVFIWTSASALESAAVRSPRLFRRQTLILMASLAVFWAGFVLYLPPLSPLPGLDTVAIGFSVSGLLILVGMWRFRLLEIVPIARDVLVEKMADGLIVLGHLEEYVSAHSEAQFSHGLCPDCLRRLYPDLVGEGDGSRTTR